MGKATRGRNRPILRADPREAAARINARGRARAAEKNWAEAETLFRRALSIDPSCGDAAINLVAVLAVAGKPTAVADAARTAVRLRPDLPHLWKNLALALIRSGRPAEAIGPLSRAVALDPGDLENHRLLAHHLLARGDYTRGWEEHGWFFAESNRRFPVPEWDGSPLDGRTIYLHNEHGLGDTIQFVRYAPLVKRLGGRVIVACQRPLLRLLASCPGIDELIPIDSPVSGVDVHARFYRLPLLCKTTTLDAIPANVPYLSAEPELVALWRRRFEPVEGFRVGIAWGGSATNGLRERREIPPAQFEALARIEGVRLISLQKGPGAEQLPQPGGRFPVVRLGDEADPGPPSIEDLAAIMMNLDGIISLESMPAHLAGALGRPAWIPLSVDACWRWLLDRDDSPWYPTARLFRQARPGDWDDVFRRIAAAVREAMADRGWAQESQQIGPGRK